MNGTSASSLSSEGHACAIGPACVRHDAAVDLFGFLQWQVSGQRWFASLGPGSEPSRACRGSDHAWLCPRASFTAATCAAPHLRHAVPFLKSFRVSCALEAAGTARSIPRSCRPAQGSPWIVQTLFSWRVCRRLGTMMRINECTGSWLTPARHRRRGSDAQVKVSHFTIGPSCPSLGIHAGEHVLVAFLRAPMPMQCLCSTTR